MIDSYNISQARELFAELEDDKSENYQFLAAYFNRDASQAISVYENLYSKTKSQSLKNRIQKKLYDYYYSLGYYIRAESYKNTHELKERIQSPVILKKTGKLIIQCGVFGSESNAQMLKEKIATKIESKVYLTRDNLNGQTVFRVIVGNFSTYADVEDVKQLLKSELGINGFVKTVE